MGRQSVQTDTKGADDRLIVALDVPDITSAIDLVHQIGDSVSFYKIGLSLLGVGGLGLAARLKFEFGKRVFLDLKLFDINNTVQAAVRSIAKLDPDLLTVHGDPHVVQNAVRANDSTTTKILAVTILTSLDREDLNNSMLVDGDVNDIVVERAKRAFAVGADGVVCSPLEAKTIRDIPAANGKLIVTPGTRPNGTQSLGQKRVATPSEAIRCGADHLVVGRPITRSVDPRNAVHDILKDLPKPSNYAM